MFANLEASEVSTRPSDRPHFESKLRIEQNTDCPLCKDCQRFPLSANPIKTCFYNLKQMETCFLSLPDYVILEIFDYLSLPALLNVGLACRRLQEIQRRTLQFQQSLTVQIGARFNVQVARHAPYLALRLMSEVTGLPDAADASNNIKQLDDWRTSLKFSNLGPCTLCWLISMPRINELKISFDGHAIQSCNSPFKELILLLRRWAPRLVSLTLLCKFDDNPAQLDGDRTVNPVTQVQLSSLLAAINQMPALRNLTLSLDRAWPETNDHIELPILAQLDRFYFKSSNSSRSILETLKRHGQPHGRPLRIGLSNLTDIDALGELDRQYVSQRFVQLDQMMAVRQTRLQLPMMTGLVEVAVTSFTGFTPDKLNRALAHCPRLIYLYLDLSRTQFFITPAATPVIKLSTLKVLAIRMSPNRRICLRQLNIDLIYPNIEVLGICRYIRECAHPTASKKELFPAADCLGMFLQIFEPCAKLRLVLVNHSGDHRFLPYGQFQVKPF